MVAWAASIRQQPALVTRFKRQATKDAFRLLVTLRHVGRLERTRPPSSSGIFKK